MESSYNSFIHLDVMINQTGVLFFGTPGIHICNTSKSALLYRKREAEHCRPISDKARIASVLNYFLTSSFFTHLVCLYIKEFSI